MLPTSHSSESHCIHLDVVELLLLIHLLEELTNLIDGQVTPFSAAMLNHPLKQRRG